ncbi:MAG: glycosyltransferase family 2 protein [Bacteroidota bacterium]
MAEGVKLSIVILNYNSGDFLVKCLDSVFADDLPFSCEVIVPDNASSDDSLKKAEQKWGSRIAVISNPKNGGFNYGNNIGIRHCKGKYICLLNPDTIIHRGAFKTLLDFIEAHPRVGFVGPKVLNRDGSFQLSARRSIPSPFDAIARALLLSKLFPHSKMFARYNLTFLSPDQTQQVDASTGCCLFARRAMIDQIGLLDEGFYIYCEDVDWFLRAKNAGWETWYVAEAVIEHHHAYSERFRKHRAVIDFHKSMIYLYRKHYAKTYPFLFNWIIYLMVYIRMIALICLKTVKRWK